MTFALAALTPTDAIVAADTQEVTFAAHGSVTTAQVAKTVTGRRGAAVAAGITRTPSGSLADHLARAVAGPASWDQAVSEFVDRASATLGPYQEALLQRFAEGDVVWEAAIVGTWFDTGPRATVLTGHVTSGQLGLDVRTVQARPDHAHVLALGARHPLLTPLDLRYHDSYPDLAAVAKLMRMPPPAAPVLLPDSAPDVELSRRLRQALETEREADRPHWWPGELPVATGPITFGHVPLATAG